MNMEIISEIDRNAALHPERIAYDYLGQQNTYGELKAASDAIAANITARYLDRKRPIMVYADQQFTTIAAFLGCVKAGHAYIPVDTHSPNERLTMIAEIAQPVLTIATAALSVELSMPIMSPTELAMCIQNPEQQPKVQLQPVSGDENFYIIFTSGTTGQPKGVQISSTNLRSFTDWMRDFKLPQQPRFLVQAPYSFDLSVMSLYPTLLAGGTLVVLPRAESENLGTMFKLLPSLHLDVWVSTPSFMAMCLLDNNFTAAHYPELKQIFFCGEELTNQLASTILERFPDVELYNTYGPTETTVAVTAVQITQALLQQYSRLPIGYAKADTTISLVTDAPAGTEGELLISGPSVSRGYINRPEKTAAVFSTQGGKRSYRSGDLGTIAADGLVFYHGRTDFQIKMNGYRIELEEVNHFLNASKYIKQGVAIPRYGADHKVKQLLAYIVPEAGALSGTQLTVAIKAELKQMMMAYMIPQRFVYRDQLPLTANDKVAIKALISEVNDHA
ncbi:D-alanine--poly(phosphoribitol) ligase subunit DltA [Lacticaseibacillus zhaodongensis]|uniref:D-alanine--poly(phosphoribitol) ligase subunit DltA n=1 Tax=Lacticaseibacillus zhaodongensis TaxID=2668065 RepID=UPI0012D2F02D|nr:D-alanine--poly(phosphoribitol) ligase subunit DltA [Lacticaseibacillus zhaodongensis]